MLKLEDFKAAKKRVDEVILPGSLTVHRHSTNIQYAQNACPM